MQHATRIRQVLHEQAGTARMIEMNVRKKYIFDCVDREVLLSQRVEQQRHAAVGARINERGGAVLNDEVARVLERTRILSVYRNNARVQRCRAGAVQV